MSPTTVDRRTNFGTSSWQRTDNSFVGCAAAPSVAAKKCSCRRSCVGLGDFLVFRYGSAKSESQGSHGMEWRPQLAVGRAQSKQRTLVENNESKNIASETGGPF